MQSFALSACLIYLGMLPFAVAGQYIGGGVATVLILIVLGGMHKLKYALTTHTRLFWIPLCGYGIFLGSALMGTLSNPNLIGSPAVFFGGHIYSVILPVLIACATAPFVAAIKKPLAYLLMIIGILFGLVALSQYIWGWKLMGTGFQLGFHRARGFYSHPLTFAYILILILPMSMDLLRTRYPSWLRWSMFVGVVLAIIFSQSKIIQLISGAYLFWWVGSRLSGKHLWISLIMLFVASAGVFSTSNLVSDRFQEVVGEHPDRQSPYADDRLAFWQVHWQMFLEKPFFGHGVPIATAYRAPYYEKFNLGYMKKKYEAHNTYLQILVEAGILGLAGYLLWFLYNIMLARKLCHKTVLGRPLTETLVLFGLGCFTQNAFQDSTVRYGLCLFIALLWTQGTAHFGPASASGLSPTHRG